MIDERFSASAFAQCGLDTKASRHLANRLAEEVLNELHIVISERFIRIIEQLNSMGHNLIPVHPPVAGNIGYRDDWEDESAYHCKLRVAVDTIISTGYAHLLTEEQLSRMDFDSNDVDNWPDKPKESEE